MHGVPWRAGLPAPAAGLGWPGAPGRPPPPPAAAAAAARPRGAAAPRAPRLRPPRAEGGSSAQGAGLADRGAAAAEPPGAQPPPPPKRGRGRPPGPATQALRQQQELAARAAASAAAAEDAAAAAAGARGAPTEMIFKLERRGSGWGEEILPRLTVERRPLGPAAPRRAAPAAWPPGSLEALLASLGVPPAAVPRVVEAAVAWRVTPGGRPLLDRRRRQRVERNAGPVAEYLVAACGVEPGPAGVAAVLARAPKLMLCKPSTNDRWDRRAVELAAFLHRHGHCNVPEDWGPSPELAAWVGRQRAARAAGLLPPERAALLAEMGFEFGDLAQVTDEWERRFDRLVDWVLWHRERGGGGPDWRGEGWGAAGGTTARELAAWLALQGEYRRRGLLPAEALRRFDAVGVRWGAPAPPGAAAALGAGSGDDDGESGDDAPAQAAAAPAVSPAAAQQQLQPPPPPPQQRPDPDGVGGPEWMAWLGRLLYAVEREAQARRPPSAARPVAVPKLAGRPTKAAVAAREAAAAAAAADGGGAAGAGGDDDSDDDDGEERGRGAISVRRGAGTAAAAAARARLVADVAERRRALAGADLRAEPGLRFWLARQRRAWRARRLPPERAALLQLAGADLDGGGGPTEWRSLAHSAAALLTGAAVPLGPAPPAPPPAPGAGSPRLRVQRWAQAQGALHADGRLSPAQLRYLGVLGLAWVLDDAAVRPDDAAWRRGLEAALAHARGGAGGGGGGAGAAAAEAWLTQQRGLAAVGLLPAPRRAALGAALGVGWERHARAPGDAEWDARLGELLTFWAERRHVDVAGAAAAAAAEAAAARGAGGGGVAAAGAAAAAARLAAWVAEQQARAAAGALPPARAAQLEALGVPLPGVAAAEAAAEAVPV